MVGNTVCACDGEGVRWGWVKCVHSFHVAQKNILFACSFNVCDVCLCLVCVCVCGWVCGCVGAWVWVWVCMCCRVRLCGEGLFGV